jgi:hypothetical protein
VTLSAVDPRTAVASPAEAARAERLLKKIDGAAMSVGEDIILSDGQDQPAEAERVYGADLKRAGADPAAALVLGSLLAHAQWSEALIAKFKEAVA